jgi:tetratricopeptide (TPR) repeat protein
VPAASLSAALDPLLARVAAVVDDKQPERVEPGEREAMARLGARDVAVYRDYAGALDEFFSTPFLNVPSLAKRIEAVIARDPGWAHPHALLMHTYGIYSPDARAARDRGRRAVDRGRDPIGESLLALESDQSREALTAVAAAQDRAFTAAPDDMLLGWSLAQVLSQLDRHQEFLAVLRSLHRTRPDLQFGTDVEESLRVIGLGHEIPALQAAWLRDAPANEQAWVGQLMVELAAGNSQAAAARARDILLLFGRSAQRLSTLLEVLEHREDLAEASAVANELLRGTQLERALGWFGLGQIAMLQGRFSAAREAWRTSAREAQTFGSQGPREQSLEELVALDAVIGDDADLEEVLAQLIGEYRAASNHGLMTADQIVRAGHESPRRCLDVAAMVRSLAATGGEAGYEREVWRAAAQVGCARCRDVVQLGLAPDERRVRSTFALATCAEREGNLDLARDAFGRARSLRTLTLQASESPATAYSVLASYELGRTLSRAGRAAEARAAYADFMAHWGHADRPVAQVDDARRALAALAGTR